MGHRPDWNNKNFKKTSVRGFADGGDVDAREAARDSAFTTPLPEREPIVDNYEYGRYEEQESNKARYEADQAQMARDAQEAARELSNIAEAKAAKKQSFSEAFAENRKAGKKTFEWNGKLYGTELAKPAPQGDQKVEKMFEQEAAVGRQLREAAAKVSDAKQRQIILDKAAESDVRAKQLGKGYAFSANAKK